MIPCEAAPPTDDGDGYPHGHEPRQQRDDDADEPSGNRARPCRYGEHLQPKQQKQHRVENLVEHAPEGIDMIHRPRAHREFPPGIPNEQARDDNRDGAGHSESK